MIMNGVWNFKRAFIEIHTIIVGEHSHFEVNIILHKNQVG
jgi:hypothetical protein